MRILWTEPAAAAFRRLPKEVQRDILDRIDLLSDFPDLYPVRDRQPYAGFRYFFVRRWCVSYVTADGTLIILAVFPTRRAV
ncbi:MAG: type II toxin-antitoxin system RelE/ParE family toxin [Armatimonadetes bacterium]|nr:type II toxin-antitoxin system RelE/ParE family toxin [Armatimonadota bacterium]